MSTITFSEFTEEPAVYIASTDTASKKDISCVIVEDTPGIYFEFVQQLVDKGICRTAMTVPFSDKTIELLQGHEVVFGNKTDATKIRIPNPAHCVLILDMRNGDTASTVQSFTGYDPLKFELAGYQFYKQLRGFPGKIFIATRYGREQLKAEGIDGVFGVISLDVKGDYKGMPESVKADLLAAIDLVLIQLQPMDINRMVFKGKSTVEITYHGEVFSMPARKSILAFMEVVKAGDEGLSDEVLAKKIDYAPREKKKEPDPSASGEDKDLPENDSQAPEAVPEEDFSSEEYTDPAKAMLTKILQALEKNRVDGVTFKEVIARAKLQKLDVSKLSATEIAKVIQRIYSAVCEINPYWKENVRRFQDFLGRHVQQSRVEGKKKFGRAGEVEDFATEVKQEGDTRFDFTGAKGKYNRKLKPDSDDVLISATERDNAKIAYFYKAYIEISVLKIAINKIELSFKQDEISFLEEKERLARNSELKKAGALSRCFNEKKKKVEAKLKTLEGELSKVCKEKDNDFRMYKAKPRFDNSGNFVGYKPLQPTSNVADYMQKLQERIVTDIQKHCKKSSSHAFIEHLERHEAWKREKDGHHHYIGNEKWQW